jgi:uncharacterized OsmC-like protein
MTEHHHALEPVDPVAVRAVSEAFGRDPSARPAFDARVDWLGGYRTVSILAGFEGPRGDEPVEYAGTGTGPAPEHVLLAAAAQCFVVGIAGATAARAIGVRSLRVEARGQVNLPAAYGVGRGHPGFQAVELTVHLDADADRETLAQLVQGALQRAPIPATLAHPVPVTATLGEGS